MKYFVWSLVTLFILESTIDDHSTITCLRMRQIMPMINSKGFVIGSDTQEVRIFYKGSQRIYKTPYLYDSVINRIVLRSETRYRYFVFDTNSSFGIFINPATRSFSKPIPLDSFTYIKRFSDFGIFKSVDNKTLKLVSSNVNSATGHLTETYIGNENAAEGTISGKAYFSYSDKLKGIDFTISRELDSIRNSKLYEVRILTDPKPNSSKTPYLTLIKMEWVTDFDSALIDSYFKMYKNR